LIGFDAETPAIRAMMDRVPGFRRLRFALRTVSDSTRFVVIEPGFGIGACQVPLVARCRAAFDHLAKALSRVSRDGLGWGLNPFLNGQILV